MPNDDYIKRDDVKTAVFAWYVDAMLHGEKKYLDEVIAKIPAAEVVPDLVRCSDCRFYDKRDGGAPGGTGWCSRPGAGCGVPEEFFCAGAERKEEK